MEMFIALNSAGTLLAVSGCHISSLCVYSTEDMHVVMRCGAYDMMHNECTRFLPFSVNQSIFSSRRDCKDTDQLENRVKSTCSKRDTNNNTAVQDVLFSEDLAGSRLLVSTKTTVITLPLFKVMGNVTKDCIDSADKRGWSVMNNSCSAESKCLPHEAYKEVSALLC